MITNRYQVMRALTEEERDALTLSISQYGVRTSIVVDEDMAIIDGHHRFEIAQLLQVPCPHVVHRGLTEAEKFALSEVLNEVRRGPTTPTERKARIKVCLLADPSLSDRQIAAPIGVDHKTVASVRTALVATGEIPQLDVRKGKDGKSRPASQPLPAASANTEPELESDSNSTGNPFQSALNDAAEDAAPVRALTAGPAAPVNQETTADADVAKAIEEAATATLGPDLEKQRQDAEDEMFKRIWNFRRPAETLMSIEIDDVLNLAGEHGLDDLFSVLADIHDWSERLTKATRPKLTAHQGGKS